jgi:trimethylamine--corrinoid protein Co-methyltransferase
MAALSGADLIHDVGLLGNATVVVPEMIVATNEIIGMIEHLLAGVPVDKEALALEIIAEVGPGGEFVTHPHTLDRFREVWYPGLLYRGGAKAWEDGESPVFEQRVKARTCALIKAHEPEPLPEGVVAEIQKVAALSVRSQG